MADTVLHIRNALIRTTATEPKLKEVRITGLVAENLKRQKLGLFQNEVDYRVLFPHFTPPDGDVRRYRVDLAGFTGEGLVLTEFKIYDELIRTKNPWGVLHFLCRDMEKLEAAARYNKGRQPGAVQFVVAVRNSNRKENSDQIRLMLARWRSDGVIGRRPGIKESNYFSILKVFCHHVQCNGNLSWTTKFHSKGKTSFLAGTAHL